MENESLYTRLSLIADEQGMSYRKLGEQIGYNYNTLYTYKDPQKKPTKKLKNRLKILADVYKYNLTWILTGEGEKYSGNMDEILELTAKHKMKVPEAIRLDHEKRMMAMEKKIEEYEATIKHMQAKLNSLADFFMGKK